MREILSYEKYKWVDITSPIGEDLEYLKQYFNIHPLDLEDVAAGFHRASLDIFKNYASLILLLPNKPKDQKVQVSELNVFLSEDFLITVHYGGLPTINTIFEKARVNKIKTEQYLGKGPASLLYHLFDKTFDQFAPVISSFSQQIDEIDKTIFKKSDKRVVEKISFVRHDLILIHTSLKPAIEVFDSIAKLKYPLFYNDVKPRWEYLADRVARIIDQIEDYRELIEGLSAANESLISYKTNNVIRILTVMTLLFMPPTLIASIFGMNVPLILANHPLALWLILGFMLVVSAIFLVYLSFKKWL